MTTKKKKQCMQISVVNLFFCSHGLHYCSKVLLFFSQMKLILLFRMGALNLSKVTVNTFTESYVSYKCYSFELSVHQRILKKKVSELE